MTSGIQKKTAAPPGSKAEAPPGWIVSGYIKSEIDELEDWVYDDCRASEMDAATEHAYEEYQADETVDVKCTGLTSANLRARRIFLRGINQFDADKGEGVDVAPLMAAAQAVREMEDEEAAVGEIRKLLQWDQPGSKLDKFKCEIDDLGCVHYHIEFWGSHGDHGNQNCQIKLDVGPIGSA